MGDTRPTSGLHPHPRADVVPFPDPDKHEEIAADIERRGIVVPLDILADGTVVDGRTRLAIARALGIEVVPVREVEPDDPFDYMVRAALMRRDLTPSQRAMLAQELPEYKVAKAEAAERTGGRPKKTADTNVRGFTPHRASDEIAPIAGVSASYIRKAAVVAKRSPELAERVKAGELSVNEAHRRVPPEETDRPERMTRLPVPKRTRPIRPWSRHFTNWCRNALPEDRPVLLGMAREIEQALERIEGGVK